ncbi:MAG: hypothetical protein ACYSR6_14015 [Planctomycetota bacterium]|jgi:hypothetical protein
MCKTIRPEIFYSAVAFVVAAGVLLISSCFSFVDQSKDISTTVTVEPDTVFTDGVVEITVTVTNMTSYDVECRRNNTCIIGYGIYSGEDPIFAPKMPCGQALTTHVIRGRESASKRFVLEIGERTYRGYSVGQAIEPGTFVVRGGLLSPCDHYKSGEATLTILERSAF